MRESDPGEPLLCLGFTESPARAARSDPLPDSVAGQSRRPSPTFRCPEVRMRRDEEMLAARRMAR